MKNATLTLFFLLLTNIGFSQIPNSGMEQWSDSPQILNWETNSNPLTLPPYDPYIIRKDSSSHSGMFSAKFWGNGMIKPIAKTTFALGNIHPESLTLWQHVNFPPCVNDDGFPQKDTVSVLIELIQGNNVVDMGYWESTISTSSSDYTQLEIPFSQNASIYDSCRITISGGKVLGGCGFAAASTEFWIDDLSLNYIEPSCVDSSQIDLGAFCPLVVIPVCGCNGITYNNSCEAITYGGVTSWTDGVCESSSTGNCLANFTFNQTNDTVRFFNSSSAIVLNSFQWTFGDGDSSAYFNAIHHYDAFGWYEVCLTINGIDSLGNLCSDVFCDSIYFHDGCVDSSYICPPGSLCCDAPLEQPVCGCNGITYINQCVASAFGGVLSFTEGDCDSIPIGQKELAKTFFAKLSPNPTDNEAILEVKYTGNSALNLNIKTILGEIVYTEANRQSDYPNKTFHLNLSQLSAGLYWVELITEGKVMLVKKLVKEE